MSTSNIDSKNLIGPTLIFLTAIAFNSVAKYLHLPTISTSVRSFARHPLGAWFCGGIIGGLLAHWFLQGGSEHES